MPKFECLVRSFQHDRPISGEMNMIVIRRSSTGALIKPNKKNKDGLSAKERMQLKCEQFLGMYSNAFQEGNEGIKGLISKFKSRVELIMEKYDLPVGVPSSPQHDCKSSC